MKNGVELTRVYEQNLLNIWKPMKVVMEVTSDGMIKVFTSHNPWVPLMKAISSPIDVKYVSFSTRSRIQFFYNVHEEGILATPIHISSSELAVNYKFPLFNTFDYAPGLADLCKLSSDRRNPFFLISPNLIDKRMLRFVSLREILQEIRGYTARQAAVQPMDFAFARRRCQT